ncbi:MAG: DUF4012 domain-containing protein [Acidimicrobiales bacterium]
MAVAVAGILAVAAVPAVKMWAFGNGLVERSADTSRSRRERRTTVGGLVLVVATLVGAGLSLQGGIVVLATAVAGVILFVSSLRTERAHGGKGLVMAGRVAAALAVTAVGVRAEATGVVGADIVITALVVLAVLGAFACLDRRDGTGVVVGVVASAVIAAIALKNGQTDVAAAAGALLGGCAGVLVHSLPPAGTTLGRTGGPFIGAVLSTCAIELNTQGRPGQSLLVPALIVALPVAGAAACLIASNRHRGQRAVQLDERLVARGLSGTTVVFVLLVTEAALGGLAYALTQGAVRGPLAAAAGTAVLAVVLLAALSAKAYEQPATGFDMRLVVGVVVAALVLAGIGGFAARQLWRARSHLEAGRAAAEAGLDAASAGDVETSRAQFGAADSEFRQARTLIGSPVITLGRAVPVLSQNIGAVQTVTDVGIELSRTGERVATRAGAEELHVRDGRFPIEQAASVGGDLRAAIATLDQSRERLQDLDVGSLAGRVRNAVDTLNAKITSARREVGVVAEATEVAPAIFGADGPRHYFLAILTPDELRGTGGFIGTYGQLDINDGRMTLPRLGQIAELNAAVDRPAQLAALPAVYRERYGGFSPDRYWQNLTAPADFTTVATGIEAAYPTTSIGTAIDGVIAIDPIGLAALLRVTGPITVPSWPEPLTADNATRILLLDQYVQLSGEPRDEFLKQVARAVFDKLTAGELESPAKVVAALADATHGGHIKLHSTHPEEQSLFADMGAAGALPSLDGDSFQLVTMNGSETKIDYFLHRSVRYRVTVDPETGDTKAVATITVRNDAPATGLPPYVIGPSEVVGAGESRLYISFYSPLALDAARVEGKPAYVGGGTENGRFVYTFLATLAPGGTANFELDLSGRLPTGPAYSLAIGQQPTVNLDHVTVEVKRTDGKPYTFAGAAPGSIWDADLPEPLGLVAQAPDPTG